MEREEAIERGGGRLTSSGQSLYRTLVLGTLRHERRSQEGRLGIGGKQRGVLFPKGKGELKSGGKAES